MCVGVNVFSVCACEAQTRLGRPWILNACFRIWIWLKPYCVFLCAVSVRPSWVLWNLPVRSWQRMRRADLRGSPSTPLSSFTRTWLTWMETCHRTTLTTSSAACRHKCKYCLCFESYRNEAYLITCIAISKSGCRRWKMKLFHMHYEWRRYPVSNSLIIFSHLNEFPLDSATDTS